MLFREKASKKKLFVSSLRCEKIQKTYDEKKKKVE